MELDNLVDIITQEVLKKLNGIDNPSEKNKKTKKILAIYTGASIGFKQSIKEMEKISLLAEIDVLLSPAAAKIYGKELIMTKCQAEKVFKAGDDISVRKLLENVQAVVIPTLTFNSAAKIASGISDTLILNTVFHCLMCGIPVIAARNAADLEDSERTIMSMYSTPGLIQLAKGNLLKMENMGIQVIDVSQITQIVKKLFTNDFEKTGEVKKKIITQKDITEDDISRGYIRIPNNAILTPLVKDIIKAEGLQIYYA